MRRFMQTFVLAPQTPKKYYVHNDIFRYQDEVYHDNSDTESEESTTQQQQQQQSPPSPQQLEQKPVANDYYQIQAEEVEVEQEVQQSQVQPVLADEAQVELETVEPVKPIESSDLAVSEETKVEHINGELAQENEPVVNVEVETINVELNKENVDSYQEVEPVKPIIQAKEEVIEKTSIKYFFF